MSIVTLSSHVNLYSCFEKGCPTEKHQSVRDNTERHDGLWLFTVASFTSFLRDGNRCYEYFFGCVKRNKINSELLTCLLKLMNISQTTFRHCRVRFYAFLDNICRNSCISKVFWKFDHLLFYQSHFRDKCIIDYRFCNSCFHISPLIVK